MASLRSSVCCLIVAGGMVGSAVPGAAAADRVLVMDRSGRVHARVDRALAPAAAPAPAPTARAATRPPRSRTARTLRSELRRLLATGQIEREAYDGYRVLFDRALRTARGLGGTRRAELLGAIANLHDIAARGSLTPSRLPGLFLTLERNREWWKRGPLLAYGQRVEFAGSGIVWEHYPGEGIAIQPLGTFGKANGLWMAHDDAGLRALLDEMAPLAAQRGPALAWEYDFDFAGGAAPWTSAMSQATAIQALARAAQRLREPAYLELARRALPLFRLDPPLGVRLRTAVGARYLLYSYAPSQIVLNAFVQTLVGLYDYAQISGDPTAGRLFRAGDRQARRDVLAGDTGAWSLYQLGGAESTLSYHELLRDVLRNLCSRTGVAEYCATAASFSRDLREPPALSVLTLRVRARQHVLVRFRVSKVSRVGMTIKQGERVVLSTSATVERGDHAYAWDVHARRGFCDVTLVGSDLAGNVGRSADVIEVLRPRRRRTGGARA